MLTCCVDYLGKQNGNSMQEFISRSVSVDNKKHFVFASLITVSDKKRCDS